MPSWWRPSPNYSQRPEGCQVELIVVHAISMPPGRLSGDGIIALFQNGLNAIDHPECYATHGHLRVSAHFLIRRDGRLIQFVSCDQRAWHAGISIFKGRSSCNDFSIGIELEGTDDMPYELCQYHRLVELTAFLQTVYPIEHDHVVGHSHIAPGRKTDPGPFFDWPFYFDKLAEYKK